MMSVNSASLVSRINLLSTNGNSSPSIMVTVGAGETLSPEEFLRRAVMTALGSDDRERADEFIRQSGLRPVQNPRIETTANGAKIYHYDEADDRFWQSIERFSDTGTALPLGEPVDSVNANGNTDRPAPTNPADAIAERTGINRQNEQRERIWRNQSGQTGTQPNRTRLLTRGNARNTPNREAVNRNQVMDELPQTPAGRYETLERTRQGRDGGHFRVSFSDEELEALANAEDGDPRLEFLKTTLSNSRLGYSREAIDAATTGITDGTAGVWRGGTNNLISGDEARQWARDAMADRAQNSFALSSELRRRAYMFDLRARGGEGAVQQFELDLRLEEEIRQIEARYRGRINGAVNLLQQSILELSRQQEMKAAIDRLYAESNIDFRRNDTAAQQGANAAANTIESLVSWSLNHNPATMMLPDSVKQRIVNAGIGVANGTVTLAAGVQGAQDFVTDAAIDAMSYGLRQAGVDTSWMDTGLQQYRQVRAERWQSYSNLQTAQLSRLDAAVAEKVRQGLPLLPADIASLERSVGRALPQAGVQAGIAIGTGGMSLPAQIALTGAINAGLEGGAAYAQTNDRWAAGQSAAWSAVQTATIPLNRVLPGGAATAADMASGYMFAKLRGASDLEAFEGMVTQGVLGLGFGAGRRLAELTPQQRQTAWRRFTQVKNAVDEAVRGSYQRARTNLQEGADNIRQRVEPRRGQQPTTNQPPVDAATTQRTRVNGAISELPTSRRPTLVQESDGSLRIGTGTSVVRLRAEQAGRLSDVQVRELTRVTGLFERDATVNRLMTENRPSFMRERRRVFEQMARIEASDPSLTGAMEPLWRRVAEMQERADGGHSIDRHGADRTDAQLTTRLTTGVTPDGRFSPTDASTRFSSYKDWVLTREAAWQQIERANPGLDLSRPWNSSLNRSYEVTIEYNRAIDDGFVGDPTTASIVIDPRTGLPDPRGREVFSGHDPISGVTRSYTKVAWDATNNRWEVVQHFPVGRRWDDVTKTYRPNPNPNAPAVVRATLPQ